MNASEIMTENPRTIGVNDTIGEAIAALEGMDVRHLPVVDANGDLVGMVSDRDIAAWKGVFTTRSARTSSEARVTVGQVMSSDVLSVDGDADVRAIVELMLEHRIGAIPVVDGEGSVTGIVSYVDVLRGLAFEGGPEANA
jgi:acetoin utilization protein AcuB